MANQWFRLYSEFANDPKVQMLSEADQRRYVMLLCLRCSNGDVTLHDEAVAFQLRISNEEWSRTKAVLIEKGLLTEGNQPTAWDKRQYASDSSAARVKAHRERKKQACNVTETPPDTDTDTEKEPPLPPKGENVVPLPTAKDTKPKRKTRIPDPFNVTGEMRQWAADRVPAVNLTTETEKFVNYWRGSGGTKVDWVATWRTWMLKAQDDRQRHPSRSAPSAGPDFEDSSWANDLEAL